MHCVLLFVKVKSSHFPPETYQNNTNFLFLDGVQPLCSEGKLNEHILFKKTKSILYSCDVYSSLAYG